MSTPIATYSFLPWLRQGIANKIAAADGANIKLRATVPVQLELVGEALSGKPLKEPINRDVELYGPGDIVGIDNREIIKTDPRAATPNFETNYLPSIEFYDEDFPWRYTPAAPAGSRLRPWLTLVVLRMDENSKEFDKGENIKDRPLPYIKITKPAEQLFPPAEQLWAWAHVHVNLSLADALVSTDMNAVLPNFQAELQRNPDIAYSRIICPRKLDENATYQAFLMPTFESGRLAGLGLDPALAPNATHSAWADYTNRKETEHYPFYYCWEFSTGTVGDFEYLVRLLQPKPVDKRVGTRDMDAQKPGLNLPGISKPALGGVLKLGGALRVPLDAMNPADRLEVEKFDNWDAPYPHPFQTALAAFINLADDYGTKSAQQANAGFDVVNNDARGEAGEEEVGPNDPDPLITPPLYGRWHSLTQRLLEERNGDPIALNDNWVHELNLDPRFRVPAGFGTSVIQDKQEEYMDAAWEQVGEVLEANRRIRAAQLAKEISWVWHERHLKPLLAAQTEKAFLLTAPVQKRIVTQGFTIYHHINTSHLQTASVSAPLRRLLRPRGHLMRSLLFEADIQPQTLLTRINSGEVSAAPPKEVPPGVLTVNDAARTILPGDAPAPVIELLKRYPLLVYAPLVLALIILVLLLVLLFTGAPLIFLAIGVAVIAVLVYVYRLLKRWADAIRQSDQVSEENQTPEAVDQLPLSHDFVISEPGAGVAPGQGTTDSVEAIRFKTALKDLNTLLVASAAVGATPPRVTLNLPALADTTIQSINPELTIPRWAMQSIFLPPRLVALLGEEFREVMAYPEIDAPMYKPLTDISAELFLPNINLIEHNSITLLETHQKFIEAYMVGLNHEFSRELLWREYPTDMMGSYFRQFWDVSTFLSTENLNREEQKEKLRDIPPLHKWRRASELGDHDNREEGGAKEEEVVLVIRGELLKKYPNAVIYAHKARWQEKADGSVDKTQERRLVDLSATETEKPPRDKVKTPLYRAKVAPDIYFFGFDLTVREARGDTGDYPDKDKPGWFFVIKERPGEPRFGLDIKREGGINIWNDLSWEDVLPGTAAGSFIRIHDAQSFTLAEPTGAVAEKHEQWVDDVKIAWNEDVSSADLAYVLYQVPVLIAVHASEMLPK